MKARHLLAGIGVAVLTTAAAMAFNPTGAADDNADKVIWNASTNEIVFGDNRYKMVLVEKGSLGLMMGATNEQGNDAQKDEKPVHIVRLDSYYIGQTEVTQALWKAVMGSCHTRFTGDDLPVEQVSWYDCQKFIRKLNSLTGKQFSLPTEAQWEIAARGGEMGKGYKYSGSDNISSVAWYEGNSESKTHPVGQKKPNELGLYGMSGNVWEWCNDWYGDYSLYDKDMSEEELAFRDEWFGGNFGTLLINPTGPKNGTYKVARGGGWLSNASFNRVSCRQYYTPDKRQTDLGFRLCLCL